MSDLISRQAVIDAINKIYCHIEMIKKRPVNKTEQAMYFDMIGAVKSVPSAEPEIIRCKDCQYYEPGTDNTYEWCSAWGGTTSDYGFCNHAERRTDG